MMRVYKFGAIAPDETSTELLIAQMRLGHEYHNRIIEEINARRDAVRDASPPPHDPFPLADSKDTCEPCKEHWKHLRKEARKLGFFDFKPLRAEFSKRGLRHGTYTAIEDAVRAAEKTAGRRRGWKYGDPIARLRFSSWARSTHQARAQIFETTIDRWLQFADRPDTANRKPGSRRAGQRKIMRLRVGSNGRDPVWAEIPIVMHRPINGRIRWAAIHRAVVCGRPQWWVTITCSDVQERADLAPDGVVAVDVGWRKMDDGSIRVAYARDASGRVTELRLPARWVERIDRAERIQSHRDELLNALKASHPELLGRVRSPAGAVRAIQNARAEASDLRLHGTQPPAVMLRGADELERYIHRDRHLWQYQTGNTRRVVSGRRDALRNFVRDLRRRYKTVIVKDTSHKVMKEDSPLYGSARTMGQHAAPGEVVAAIKGVFSDGDIAIVKGAWTSCVCTECGKVNQEYPDLEMSCEHCGVVLDRDEVSTQNMMSEWGLGNSVDGGARKRVARFAKRHREKSDALEMSAR